MDKKPIKCSDCGAMLDYHDTDGNRYLYWCEKCKKNITVYTKWI